MINKLVHLLIVVVVVALVAFGLDYAMTTLGVALMWQKIVWLLFGLIVLRALIGVLGLKARDIVGYTVTQLVVHAPLVIFMLWALGETLIYHPPVMP